MDGKDWPLYEPCHGWGCGNKTEGVILVKGGQNMLLCKKCRKFTGKNVPKSETGEGRRSLTPDREEIKPKQRARILERDASRCLFCGAAPPDVNLNIGHVVSYAEGTQHGLTAEELNDDENLLTLCERCNSGQGSQSMRARVYLAILVRLGAKRGI